MPSNGSVVHILGAGVDKPLGMPLADELMGAVADFAEGPGKPIAEAIRSNLPRLRFSFSRYTGEQGETFAERVLAEDSQTLDTAKSILNRYLNDHQDEDTSHVDAVHKVIVALEEIRDRNQIDDQTLKPLAEISGERYQESGGDFIVDPRGISLTPLVRQAFRTTFQGLMQEGSVSPDERDALVRMATAVMNVEELLGELFSGFYTKRASDQKQYLYVAWLFWAYLRLKMDESLNSGEKGLYAYLGTLGDDHHFITMNYTARFFPQAIRPRVHFFHGDCLSYIRLETRDLITENQQAQQANSPESIADFIKSLEIDLENQKIFLPGIVPPLSVKPVICREHLETWYRCGSLMDGAEGIIVTGYSFNSADEHFNDLLRKRRGGRETKIIIINPDLEDAVSKVSEILSQDVGHLNEMTLADFECRRGGNLTFVKARTEQLSRECIEEFLD